MKTCGPITSRLSLEQVRDRPRPWMRPDRHGFSLAVLVLQPGQTCLTSGMIPHASDGGCGERPREMGLADVGPCGAVPLASRCLGTRDEATVGGQLLHPREALPIMHVVEPHAAENLPQAGHGAQAIPRVRVMGSGGRDEGEVAVTEPRIRGAEEGESDCKAFWARGLGNTGSDAVAMGWVGDLVAERRQGLGAGGRWHRGQECTAGACQGPASAPQVSGSAPLGRRDSGLREPPAAPQQGDGMGIHRVVCGLAPRNGLHREGMTEDIWETLVSTAVGQPGPR